MTKMGRWAAATVSGVAAIAVVPGTASAADSTSKVPSLVRQLADQAVQAQRQGAAGALAGQRPLREGFIPRRTDGRLELTLHARGAVTAEQEAALEALGAAVQSSSRAFKRVPGVTVRSAGLVDATVPARALDAVAALRWVAAIRPVVQPATDVGAITAEGVTVHRAGTAQSRGLTGAGQKVGAISDGVQSLAESQARGELPGDVQVLDPGSGDEGTAMLEIVHDEAPGAKLAFKTVGDSLTTYVGAFDDLVAAGSTLITEDIAFDDEPAFQQGLGATTAERVAKRGVWVSSSAGNLGAKHAARVDAVGSGRTPDGVASTFPTCPLAPDNTVFLRSTDNTYDVRIGAGGAILPTLQWSEPRAIYPTTGQGGFTDLNLYLLNAAGTDCLAWSTGVQADGVGDTIEQLYYENPSAEAVNAKLVVDVQGTSSALRPPVLDLRWRTAGVQTLDPPERRGSLNPDSNYLGNATSAGAVAADLSLDPAAIPIELYSAAGPVQIGSTTRCPGGGPGPCQGAGAPAFKTFGQPDWAATDGVSVSGVGGFGAGTCPAAAQGDCRFYGTSAAAPSAAGVAALVRQAQGGKISAKSLSAFLRNYAVKRSGDDGYGAGVLQAVK